MLLNNINVIERNNRPTVIQKVALRAFFVNDGVYTDPFDISGVTIFRREDNFTPSGVIEKILFDEVLLDHTTRGVTIFRREDNFTPSGVIEKNLVKEGLPASSILMHFDGPARPEAEYDPADPLTLSSIYKTGDGQFCVILDGAADLSGVYDFHGSSLTVENAASALDEYIDVWTVQQVENGPYHSLVNKFELFEDTFFAITEPLQVTASNRLVNKRVTQDSKVNMKIETELTIANSVVDDSIKNLFRQSAITGASVKIEKLNEGTGTLPAHVEVSGYSDTASLVEISSDNTIVLNFDTTNLATHSNVADFGGLVGNYRITAKYSLLDEVIVTPPFYFTVS